MVLGIDFGTTRVVVAAADRGNYPLITFDSPEVGPRDWFPALVALKGEERRYGWETWPLLTDPAWTIVRSLKREIRDAGPCTELHLGDSRVRVKDLLTGLASALRRDLLYRSTLRAKPDDALEVMLGVPASANSNQRFLTTEAFREAGFRVAGLLNEPSAASVECAHSERTPSRRGLLVYDLGGGTFDVSLVVTEGMLHSVADTAGIPTLGGDDFDEVLAVLALEAAGITGELTPSERFRLLDECREKKESLNPNTRKLVVDLERVRAGWKEITVPAATYYEQCRPLIERTRDIVEQLIAANPDHGIDTLYVTGGGSELPAVARILKEEFGRRVRRSAYMRSATAIGLAIAGDPRSGFRVKDRLSHHFGVWREADGGRDVAFDLLGAGRHAAARSRRAAVPRHADVSSGAQHRPFPLRGMFPPRRAAAAERRHHAVERCRVPV